MNNMAVKHTISNYHVVIKIPIFVNNYRFIFIYISLYHIPMKTDSLLSEGYTRKIMYVVYSVKQLNIFYVNLFVYKCRGNSLYNV